MHVHELPEGLEVPLLDLLDQRLFIHAVSLSIAQRHIAAPKTCYTEKRNSELGIGNPTPLYSGFAPLFKHPRSRRGDGIFGLSP